MFFGCKIKENQPFNFQKTNNIYHLSEASLGPKSDDTKVYLITEVDGQKYNLCVLKKNLKESYKLDHFIAWGKNNKSFKLLISGGGKNSEVHITGYVETEETGEEIEENNSNINPENYLELNEEFQEEKKPEKKKKERKVEEEIIEEVKEEKKTEKKKVKIPEEKKVEFILEETKPEKKKKEKKVEEMIEEIQQ